MSIITDAINIGVSSVAALAACLAVWYARKAPTSDDLARVERHVEESSTRLNSVDDHMVMVETHLDFQAKRARLSDRARDIRVVVTGGGLAGGAATLTFSTNVNNLRIDLLSREGRMSDSLVCRPSQEGTFQVPVPWQSFGDWMNNAAHQLVNDIPLIVRAHVESEDGEVLVDISVKATKTYEPGKGYCWSITGRC